MKLIKIQKAISITCSILIFIVSFFGLISGLGSIGATGFEGLGIIFIIPSLLVLVTISLDFFITVDMIKKGLIYSCVVTLIKLRFLLSYIISIIYDSYEFQDYGVSNLLDFHFIVIIFLIVFTIPSLLNTIKLYLLRKKSK